STRGDSFDCELCLLKTTGARAMTRFDLFEEPPTTASPNAVEHASRDYPFSSADTSCADSNTYWITGCCESTHTSAGYQAAVADSPALQAVSEASSEASPFVRRGSATAACRQSH